MEDVRTSLYLGKRTRKDSMSQVLKRRDFDAKSLPKTMHGAAHSLVRVSKAMHVHQMLGMLIVVAHASEITRVISHIGLWHLAIAIGLFALWLAGQHDPADELA